ncbi:hypothetical protein B0H66DRAFT_556464 [Apodospora peruviana]|uniref:Uncharacterized protein n=1 Tax=Apodospora peruviana TaxID=516989 RepID=A0AAE0M3Y8_9PEZI|nr:hypothetical protein B0H66DRAFT_556464 [Apodospora peruviana]
MCDNLRGANAPFCSPRENTQVQVGRAVDVTWDPKFFNRSATPEIFILAEFGPTGSEDDDTVVGGLAGFTSDPVDARSGKFTWTILDQYLDPQTRDGRGAVRARNARIFISEPMEDIDDTVSPNPEIIQQRIPGPRVQIVARDNGLLEVGAGGPNPLSIALPVGLGVFVLLIIAVFFVVRRWKRGRRDRMVPARVVGGGGVSGGGGAGGFFSRKGYGIGKSWGQRTRGGDDVEIIHSTHMNATQGGVRMNMMADGGNVFRDEVRRQDRARF